MISLKISWQNILRGVSETSLCASLLICTYTFFAYTPRYSGSVAEWLTRRTSYLRITSHIGLNPARGKSLFPWGKNFILIAQYSWECVHKLKTSNTVKLKNKSVSTKIKNIHCNYTKKLNNKLSWVTDWSYMIGSHMSQTMYFHLIN